jgi:hypothetical protein
MVKESVAVKKEKIKEEDEAPQMRKAEKKWYVNKEERLTRRPEEEQRPRKKRGRVKLI